MIATCINCKIEVDKLPCRIKTSKNQFCSRSCSTTFHNLGKHRTTTKILFCKSCGNKYSRVGGHRSSTFCKSCVDARLNSTAALKNISIAEMQSLPSLAGKHPSWLNSNIRNLNRTWNKELTKLPCPVCGYAIHVELCHKIPISKFPKTATLGEVNHPSNIIQLCRNHHWEFDHGILELP